MNLKLVIWNQLYHYQIVNRSMSGLRLISTLKYTLPHVFTQPIQYRRRMLFNQKICTITCHTNLGRFHQVQRNHGESLTTGLSRKWKSWRISWNKIFEMQKRNAPEEEFRPIALTSCIGKLLTSILKSDWWLSWLATTTSNKMFRRLFRWSSWLCWTPV